MLNLQRIARKAVSKRKAFIWQSVAGEHLNFKKRDAEKSKLALPA